MFLTSLQVEAVPPNLWRLLTPLVWEDAEFGRLEFAAEALTDLASIPRILRRHSAFDPGGPSRRPAVGHDDMYRSGKAGGETISRETADRFLYVALLSEGVSRSVAWMFYVGVRAGGWMPWRDYRRAEAARVSEGLARPDYVVHRGGKTPQDM